MRATGCFIRSNVEERRFSSFPKSEFSYTKFHCSPVAHGGGAHPKSDLNSDSLKHLSSFHALPALRSKGNQRVNGIDLNPNFGSEVEYDSSEAALTKG
jgi:hypothetical protein